MTSEALVPYEPPVLIPDIVEAPGATPAGVVHVVVRRNPFTLSDRVITTVPVGMTIAEILEAQGIRDVFEPRVFLDDSLVPAEWWPRVRPRAGHHVIIATVPRGGGGRPGKGSWITLVLAIAVIAVGLAVPGAGFLVAPGIGLAIGALGNDVSVNALVPPRRALTS